jgi:hypothetical protein
MNFIIALPYLRHILADERERERKTEGERERDKND